MFCHMCQSKILIRIEKERKNRKHNDSMKMTKFQFVDTSVHPMETHSNEAYLWMICVRGSLLGNHKKLDITWHACGAYTCRLYIAIFSGNSFDWCLHTRFHIIFILLFIPRALISLALVAWRFALMKFKFIVTNSQISISSQKKTNHNWRMIKFSQSIAQRTNFGTNSHHF